MDQKTLEEHMRMSIALNQNMGMEGKRKWVDYDENAGMRFVATECDTSRGECKNSKAAKLFEQALEEINKKNEEWAWAAGEAARFIIWLFLRGRISQGDSRCTKNKATSKK